MSRNYRTAILATSVLAAVFLTGCRDEPPSEVPDTIFGHCVFFDAMSESDQCKELRGENWTDSSAEEECAKNEVAVSEGACPFPEEERLGGCLLARGESQSVLVHVSGTDAGDCNTTQNGCEFFGGGKWVPGANCGGSVDLDDVYDEEYAVKPYLRCVENEDGDEVCTHVLIGGCAEEGSLYPEFGSCEDVRTQQPYYGVSPNMSQPADDPRMDDSTYTEELDWITSQANACACACCHNDEYAPDGSSIWNTAADGNWVNSFTDYGIAFAAGVLDSSLLGSFEAENNNGFSRWEAGLPSTDEARMQAFFRAEMTYRGLTEEDFADFGPQPSVFANQDAFVPELCENGEGVASDGTLTWSNGRARFVYVLEAGTQNPGVPPNRDIPEGTLWRVDTIPPAAPMKTGEVQYGVLPEGTSQVFPFDDDAPLELVSGQTYYIFTQTDLALPATRCLFVAE